MANELVKRSRLGDRDARMELHRDMQLLHPRARASFKELEAQLVRDFEAGRVAVLLKPFEVFRGPTRQEELFRQGKTRARSWQSAHGYGLAVDFVPWTADRGWHWDVPSEVWDHLRQRAHEYGLRNEIAWDRAHVEHPMFEVVRRSLERL